MASLGRASARGEGRGGVISLQASRGGNRAGCHPHNFFLAARFFERRRGEFPAEKPSFENRGAIAIRCSQARNKPMLKDVFSKSTLLVLQPRRPADEAIDTKPHDRDSIALVSDCGSL